MKFTPHRKAVLALMMANIIWGAGSPIFKLALENLPPFTLAFIRFYFGAMLIFPLTRGNINIQRRDIGNLLLLSICGISINIAFFFLGLSFAPSINAPIIASSAPILLIIFSIISLHEKPSKKVLFGTLISLMGILIIIGRPSASGNGKMELVGNLFFLIATLGSVYWTIISKKIKGSYKVATISFWSFFIGTITFFPFFLYEYFKLNPFATIDYRGWLGIFVGIVFSSITAYSLYEFGLRKISASEIGLFTYIDPLAAAILAYFLLGEKITPLFLIGSVLVLGGIFIAEKRFHYHPLHKLRN